jgi:3-isopropylmalate dehydrogenase
MMLRFSFDMSEEADAIENAVSAYLDVGYRTADIMNEGMTPVGCKKCGELIVSYLKRK